MQRISSSLRKYPILFKSWLVSGSPIDLTTSFDWEERRFRILDTGIESVGNLKGLEGTYSSQVPKAWSTVSCEALELCKVNVFLASPIRR